MFARQTEKEDIISVLEPGKHAADLIKSLVDKLPQSAASKPAAVPPPRPPPPSGSSNTSSFASILANSVTRLVNRLPEMGGLNIGQSPGAPSVPPRMDASASAPSVPQHQQHYQPNTAQNLNWYQGQPPQQYQGYQQPYPQQGYYQQMATPNLPYYGAAFQQPVPGGRFRIVEIAV